MKNTVAKRSITDREIGLIKAMLARNMKNKDIQFRFNRPNRAVNSGRITGIANGSYSNSADIPAALGEELDAFLASTDEEANENLSLPRSMVDDGYLLSMFTRTDGGDWQLGGGESDTRECKANFGLKHGHQWVKAIAALANNRGGHVFFGVADGSYKKPGGGDLPHGAVGMSSDEFAMADPADITSKLKSFLDPTPRIERTVLDLDGQKIGVIHVEQHPSRPVIATKADGERIREGDIFYRYPGQSSRIKYSDLRGLLDERDAQARMDILPMVERLLQLGPHRAFLADLEEGKLHDGKQTITLDPALIDQIKFIREGSFDEVEGAPALKLVGTVVPRDSDLRIQSRGAITDDTLLTNFLKQETISQPREYIRYAAGAGHAAWLPLRYFAFRGKLNRADAAQAIRDADGTTKRKNALIAKVENDKAARYHYAGSPKSVLAKLRAGELVDADGVSGSAYVAQAICGLDKLSPLTGPSLLSLLSRCREQLVGKPGMSYVRRAACRIDELMYPFGSEGEASN